MLFILQAQKKITSLRSKAILIKTSLDCGNTLILTTLWKILLQSHATKQIYVFAAGVITSKIVHEIDTCIPSSFKE